MATRERNEYRTYLESDTWRQRREAALRRASNRCQLCNYGGPLVVHHRTYAMVGNESPSDLTVLCRTCHEHFHRGPRKVGRT